MTYKNAGLSALVAARAKGTKLLDVEKAIRDLSIDLQFHDCWEQSMVARLHRPISAKAITSTHTSWAMEIDARLPESARRFAMTRMLAHRLYFAEKLTLADGSAQSTTDTISGYKLADHPWSENRITPEFDHFASQIAIKLLFPAELVCALHSYGATLEEMAEDLISTPEAIKIRISTLGLTPHNLGI